MTPRQVFSAAYAVRKATWATFKLSSRASSPEMNLADCAP